MACAMTTACKDVASNNEVRQAAAASAFKLPTYGNYRLGFTKHWVRKL